MKQSVHKPTQPRQTTPSELFLNNPKSVFRIQLPFTERGRDSTYTKCDNK